VRLGNKVALVTGAGAGIGKQIALTLAEEGADIVVNDISLVTASKTCDEITALGRKALPVEADVSDYNQVEAMVEKAVRTFGRIDILVNNAGKTDSSGKPEDLKLEDWNRMLAVTLTGVFICSQLVGREMIKRKSGKIINIASTAGLIALPDSCDYTAAKHGVVGLTKALAIEWGKYGISVNCVAPGSTLTARAKREFKRHPRAAADRTYRVPLGRLAKPIDQARVVAFLASSDADYVSGQTIVVDGGTYALYAGYTPPK
jgi:NAD(P)-dependent dehydrogenase (short-subunit alcohol dehydrogenase family)